MTYLIMYDTDETYTRKWESDFGRGEMGCVPSAWREKEEEEEAETVCCEVQMGDGKLIF